MFSIFKLYSVSHTIKQNTKKCVQKTAIKCFGTSLFDWLFQNDGLYGLF